MVMFAVLPLLTAEVSNFQPTTTDEIDFFEKQCHWQAGVQIWLKYLVSGNKRLDPELIANPTQKNKRKALKKRAELSKSILDLTHELYSRYPLLQEAFKSHEEIWFLCESQEYHFWLSSLGVLPNSKATRPSSKEEMVKSGRRLCAFLEDPAEDFPSTLGMGQLVILDMLESLVGKGSEAVEILVLTHLLVLAAYTATVDSKFGCSPVYEDVQKKITADLQSRRTDPDYKNLLFKNGKRLPSGRNAPRLK